MSYIPFQRSVSKTFRDLLMCRYPALVSGANADIFRHLAQYILFGRFAPAEDVFADVGNRLVMPATTVAAMANRSVSGHGFSVARLLEEFSHSVWPLDVCEHRYVEGRARTVSQAIPADIYEAFIAEQYDWEWAVGHRVWFVSGKPLTRNTCHRARLTYEGSLLAAAAKTPLDHPARALVDYLNSQPQVALGKLIRRNWPSVVHILNEMPCRTGRERHRRDHAARVMAAIRDYEKIIYTGSERTTRIFAQGLTINQLPRVMRQAALGGALHCDIRSCQLAVAAFLWKLPRLTAFLAQCPARSIWQELLTYLDVGEEHKDILKRALYAVIFGAKAKTVFQIIRDGNNEVAGLGDAQRVHRFRSHYLIRELFDQRDQHLQMIASSGQIVDAFGRSIPLGSREPRSLLAEQIQSYEMQMVLALLPTLQSDSRIVLLNHLHDGFSVYSSRPGDYESLAIRLQKVFGQAASNMGLKTSLEVST